ncbi:MAG TPA: erythromycin esterase family protein [Kofleriaceae bacterium]|jgi:erythromycin esterase-like protein|nr:erythromycin esterase family protein [Kofleriaceae bacterium]
MVTGIDGEVREAVGRIARPVHSEPDLDRLLEPIAAARIVLIGEASHGAHELNDLRGTLTRKLIAEHGFAAVAIAGGWSEAIRVDRYVRGQGDDESAAAALVGFERFPTWMWRNADVAAFAEWLATWNAQRPADQRAGFYGLDLYSMHVAIRSLLSFLEETDPAAAHAARALYTGLDQVALAGEHRSGLEVAASHEQEVVAQLVEMQRRHAARSGRTPTGDGWFHAMQSAHVLQNAEAYYRTLLRGRVAWNARDARMADAIDMLADELGRSGQPAKLVVWAHNRHVGDARATAMGEAGEISLGQVLRQRHPGETALIGMTTYGGTVTCARGWDEPAEVATVPPGLDGSWEQLLHGSGYPRFYLGTASLRRAVGDGAERLQRAIGVVYRPETERLRHYHLSRLADAFDVVIHIDATRAVTGVDVIEGPVEPTGAVG